MLKVVLPRQKLRQFLLSALYFTHIIGEEGSVLGNVVEVLGLQSVSRKFVSHFFSAKNAFFKRKNPSILVIYD